MDIEHIDYADELILVVDDEEAIRELLVEMLSHLGFRAYSVDSGAEALRELKEKPYTFLLTDIKISGMNGVELIRRVKQDYPHICSIAMTGYSKEYGYIDVVNAGAADFINKHFVIEELEAKVRRSIIERNVRQELNRLSITDSLTGLYNQRHFYARLKDEIMRAQRQKNRLALMLLDLDDFKRYNDTHGHLAGDAVLQKVGIVINAKIRQGVDSGYRYGGDEFAVIMIDAESDIASVVGMRIEEGIKEECNLGVCMGYAYFSDGMTPEAFVDRADEQLYKIKGRKNNQKGLAL